MPKMMRPCRCSNCAPQGIMRSRIIFLPALRAYSLSKYVQLHEGGENDNEFRRERWLSKAAGGGGLSGDEDERTDLLKPAEGEGARS